jgi:hypothetical protein
MPEWIRNFPWRQGNLLTAETVTAINLSHPNYPDDTVVIIATHDCDLAQLPDKEPYIEVIIGRRIQNLDGNNTYAKSSRTLHIAFEGSEPMLAEFVITDKCNIDKTILADFAPEPGFKLSPPYLSTFQLWLASRYRRSAFPDSFERRMKETGLAAKIAKAVKQYGEMITAVFFDVDEGQEIPRATPDDVYVLDIMLLHETTPDLNAAENAANTVKKAIEQAFKSKLYGASSRGWHNIELRYVDVISEETLTYRQSKLLRKWRLDHISLGAEPQQPVLAE